MKEKLTVYSRVVFAFAAVLIFCAGCNKGPAEKAGEKIDRNVEKAKDAVNPPGPAEKAGRAADKALNGE